MYTELIIEGGGVILFRLELDLISELGYYDNYTGTLNINIIENLLYCSCKYNFIFLQEYHELWITIKNENNNILHDEIEIEDEIWYTSMKNVYFSMSYKNYCVIHYKNKSYDNKPRCKLYCSRMHKIYFIQNSLQNNKQISKIISNISGLCLHGNLYCCNICKETQLYYDKKNFTPISSLYNKCHNKYLFNDIYKIIFLFKNLLPNETIRYMLSFLLKSSSGFFINLDKNHNDKDLKTFLCFHDCYIYFNSIFYGKIITCDLSTIGYMDHMYCKRYTMDNYRKIF